MGLLRAIVHDIMDPWTRLSWLETLLAWVPGETGFALRRMLIGRRFRSAGEGLRIFPRARILGPGKLSVGKNCHIGLENVIQANGEVELGDDVLLGPGVKIWSVNHRFASTEKPVMEQGYDLKRVRIGNGVWIGANAFVMPGATIGDHVVVAAGSVVSGKDIEPYAIIAGNPARKIGSRLDRRAVEE